MMVNLMRSNQRWLMIVVSVLVLISFLYYFSNGSRVERLGGDRGGTIYGKNMTVPELQRAERQLTTAGELGLNHIYAPELTQQVTLDDALVYQYVMEHQAEALGILPSAEEVDDAAQKISAFRGADGNFDPAKKDEFIEQKLNPRGFTESQVVELVRRDLQFAKLRQIVESTVVVTPTEVRTRYEQSFAQTDTSIIRFKNADFLAGTDPSEDDIKKTYDAQKDQYEQPEKRKVQYVRFGLDDAQKKLTGKERMEALTPMRDQAVSFLVKLTDAKGKEDFAAIAKAANLPVRETGEFEEAQPGPEESSIAGFGLEAFKLTSQEPDSDVPLRSPLQASEAFYILHLSGVTPARPLTLEEARPKIVAALKDERARAALSAKAEEVRSKIAEALKAGKPFADAAKEAGQPAEDLPGFALGSQPPPNAPPDFAEIATAGAELSVGDMSKFLPSSEGGSLVYVRSRSGVAQQPPAHHRREGERDHCRDDDRDREGHREFVEELAHHARHEQQRDEDRDEGDRQRDDGEADLPGAAIGRLQRRHAILDEAHHVLDHDDGVVDDEAGRDNVSALMSAERLSRP